MLCPAGSRAFTMFQEEMSVLLRELQQRGAPDPEDQDIATQLCRVLQDHPEISEARVLSEIGILFVEGFETTGERISVASGGWSVLAHSTFQGGFSSCL